MGWGPAYLPAVTPVTTGPDLTASDRGIAKVWVRRQGSGRTRQALGDEAGAFARGNASERGTPFHQSCSYMSNL
jgi:hypothetical protein